MAKAGNNYCKTKKKTCPSLTETPNTPLANSAVGSNHVGWSHLLSGLLIPYMASMAGKPVVLGRKLVPKENKFDWNEKTNGKGKQLAPVTALFLENICQRIQRRLASSLEHR